MKAVVETVVRTLNPDVCSVGVSTGGVWIVFPDGSERPLEVCTPAEAVQLLRDWLAAHLCACGVEIHKA